MQQYYDQINSCKNITFEKIRDIANESISHLPKVERDKLYYNLKHGVVLLDSHELMCQYLWSYGRMHEAKIKKALSCFTKDVFTHEFDIVDWGCGQGLATICFFDVLEELNLQNKVQNVRLIDPSTMALERAVQHVNAYLKDIDRIKPIAKYLNDVTHEDIHLDKNRKVFHFFSNILDIKQIDLKELAIRLDQSVLNDNFIICVGPLNYDNQRIDAFYNHFNTPELFIDEKVSQYFYGGSTSCTYNIKVYKLSADIVGNIIPIEYYPSVQFHAGYQLDFVKEEFAKAETEKQEKVAQLYKSLSSFDTSAPFDIGANVYDDVHPILAVLNNIITRGLPTKASPFIEREFEKAFGDSLEKNDDGALSFISRNRLNNPNELFLALHAIDSRLVLDDTNYNLKALDSDFEKEFITKVAHKSLRQLLQPQRSLSSITKDYKKHFAQRVDFAVEFPYSTKDGNGEVKGVVVELDGDKFHRTEIQQINDKLRIEILHQNKWSCLRVTGSEIERLSTISFSNDYLQNILKTGEKQFNATWVKTLQIVLSPIAIARVQKTVLEALMTGQLDLNQPVWKVLVDEKDVPCAAIAFNDLRELFNNLTQLSVDYQNLIFPEVQLEIISSAEFSNSPLHLDKKVSIEANPGHFKTEYDLVIDISVLRRNDIENISFTRFKSKNSCYFNIRSSNYRRSARTIYTSDKIQYRNLVDRDIQGRYHEIKEAKIILKYFLQLIFRKEDFRPGQLPILNRALQNKSVIGLLPTGGGKSLTYQLAAMLQPGVTLVVDPLRSLMKDQFDGLLNAGIDCCSFINSSIKNESPTFERDRRVRQMESSELLFMFLSPERLSIYKFRETLRNMHQLHVYFSYGVIDEVHCVSEWGHDFRFSYLHLGRNLYNFVRTKQGPLTLFGLTATASFDVLADVERELSGNGAFDLDADTIVRYENTNRLELQYKIERVDTEFPEDKFYDKYKKLEQSLPKAVNIADKWATYDVKKEFLSNYIRQIPKYIRDLQTEKSIQAIKQSYTERQEPDESINNKLSVEMPDNFFTKQSTYKQAGIVFCPHKDNTGVSVKINKDSLENYIRDIGSFAGSSDGDGILAAIQDEESTKNLELFRDNKQAVMVATKAFGMGIDKPNVRFTVNMNYSSSLESFVQEAGRAGRDRKMALSVILLSDYKLARINKNCPTIDYPLGILKNKWFRPDDLNIVLDHYKIMIDNQYIDFCTPVDDLVKLFCPTDHKMFSFNECGNNCGDFASCQLKKIPVEAKGFVYEKDLKEIIENLGLDIEKRCFQYQNADFETVIYFYNNNFKGSRIEKEFMHKLLSVNSLNIFLGDDAEIKSDEIFTVKGFLTSVLSANIGTEIVSLVSYTEETSTDIAKAIYRMTCIELLEDFTQDYSNHRYRIVAKRKADGEYYQGLKRFLMRYYTEDRAEQEINKVSTYKGENEIHKCLGYLTEFVYEKIAIKRKRAIDDMRTFCLQGLDETKDWKERNEELKDFIYYYFNSKYAKDDYIADNGEPYSLKQDTDKGKVSSLDVLFKYMKVINDELVGVGTPKDNVKHLQGAVRLIRRSLMDNNPTLSLLNAFCLLFLGTNNNENLEKELVSSYIEGLMGFETTIENPIEFWKTFEQYNSLLRGFSIKHQLSQLSIEVTLAIHRNHLKNITNKYLQ